MGHRAAPEAEADLDEIWIYIARAGGSLDIADRFIDTLTSRLYLLAKNPYLGRRRDEELRPGLRSFQVKEDVLILRVLRGSRDIDALLRNY